MQRGISFLISGMGNFPVAPVPSQRQRCVLTTGGICQNLCGPRDTPPPCRQQACGAEISKYGLVRRTRADLEKNLADYYIFEIDKNPAMRAGGRIRVHARQVDVV